MTTTQNSLHGPSGLNYEGGCDCGAVRWRANVDLQAGTIRCNCTYCTKVANWAAFVKPGDFELLAGRDSLVDYRRGARTTDLYFCRTCGVRSFAHGDAPWMGGEYYAIQVRCLDDQDALAGVPIRTFDGRHDDWQRTRDEVAPPSWPEAPAQPTS